MNQSMGAFGVEPAGAIVVGGEPTQAALSAVTGRLASASAFTPPQGVNVALPPGIVSFVVLTPAASAIRAVDWIRAQRSAGLSVAWVPMSPSAVAAMAQQQGVDAAVAAVFAAGAASVMAGPAAAVDALCLQGAVRLDRAYPAAGAGTTMRPLLIVALAAAGVFGAMWLWQRSRRPSYAPNGDEDGLVDDEQYGDGPEEDEDDDGIDESERRRQVYDDDHDQYDDADVGDDVSDVDDSEYEGGELSESSYTPNRRSRGRRGRGARGGAKGKRPRKHVRRARRS